MVRYSFTRSLSSRWLNASVAKPMMAFMGVRISWDILERKVLLARLAFSAAATASESAWFACLSAVRSDRTRMYLGFVPQTSTAQWANHMEPAMLPGFPDGQTPCPIRAGRRTASPSR